MLYIRSLLVFARRCASTLRLIFSPAAETNADAAGTVADLDDAGSLVHDEITRGKELIAKRVDSMKLLTEQEVLACGSALSSIFEHVRKLMVDAESAMSDSIHRYEAATTQFGRGIQEDGRAQEAAVADVLQLGKGIEGAIGSIDTLTRVSKMLAINTRIEAARIGEQGQAFAVISDRMRELSDAIRVASDQVKSAIVAMHEAIPPIMERAASISARTESFIGEVERYIDSSKRRDADLGKNRLEDVVQLSNQALSHLQFQDRLQQQLASINRAVDILDERAARVLVGERDLGEFEDVHMPGDGQPGSGAVMLF